jgi:uncharacterized membrane protein
MIKSMLMGFVAGMRAMTPLAAVTQAARHGTLPADNGLPAFVAHSTFANIALLLAGGELLGDKWSRAPDRIVAAGMLARITTGAFAGAALAPRDRREVGAVVGAATAVGASYLTFHARMRALRRFGQVRSGLVEDAVAIGMALCLVRAGRSDRMR